MGALFGGKCEQQGLVVNKSEEDAARGLVTDTFMLWCQKLERLSEEDFKRGMMALESRQAKMYADGKDMWPPSYAEFIGLCKESEKESRVGHEAYRHFDRSIAIEDKTAKQVRFESGKKNCDQLLKMFE